jgi:hypothetical protein
MIFSTTANTPGELLAITQNDHACFASELLALFRIGGLPEHAHRRELLFATREHDNGWRETDAAPSCDSEGRPHDFLSLPVPRRQELWRRGVERFRGTEPRASALILAHAINLHREREEEGFPELVAAWREEQESLFDEEDIDGREIEEEYRWLDLADQLSLALSSRWQRSFEAYGFRIECSGDQLTLDPFPLAGATRFEISCRRIPRRTYRGDGDLAVELASARWQSLPVRVAPADSNTSLEPLGL